MEPVTAAYCGLYCESCALYKTTQDYFDGKIEKPNEICRGCDSDTLGSWCGRCGLKMCAREKGHRFCIECSDFPCDDLTAFANDPDYPYHAEVFESLRYMKTNGVRAWMEQQKQRWQCGNCGSPFHWWQTSCPGCGKETNGYVNPSSE